MWGATFHDSWMKIAGRVSGGVLLRRDIGEEDSAQCLALVLLKIAKTLAFIGLTGFCT